MDHEIRVILVEDHAVYRDVVSVALDKAPNITLVKIFGAAETATRWLKEENDPNTVDMILLDLGLPGESGLQALPTFLDLVPNVNVVILTQSRQEADVTRAIALGASGYLLKSATITQIVEGIRAVARGGAWLDPEVAKYILNTLKSSFPEQQAESILTPRELEVIGLLADGLTKKEIAKQLGVSVSTISHHVVNIFEKFNVKNAPAAVAKAFRLGIFDNES